VRGDVERRSNRSTPEPHFLIDAAHANVVELIDPPKVEADEADSTNSDCRSSSGANPRNTPSLSVSATLAYMDHED
jgi:hypothetical protein